MVSCRHPWRPRSAAAAPPTCANAAPHTDLDSEHPEFPKDTGRPGANWFLRQIDFPTAANLHVLEQRVAVMKDNLSFVLRVDGDFLESP